MSGGDFAASLPARRAALLLALALATSAASAQFNARAQASYRSETLDLQLIWLDDESATAAVSATLSQGSCSGSLAGLGRMSQRRLVIEPYRKLPQGEDCRLVLDFDARWNEVRSSTQGHCAPYAGAACEFAAQTARRQRP